VQEGPANKGSAVLPRNHLYIRKKNSSTRNPQKGRGRRRITRSRRSLLAFSPKHQGTKTTHARKRERGNRGKGGEEVGADEGKAAGKQNFYEETCQPEESAKLKALLLNLSCNGGLGGRLIGCSGAAEAGREKKQKTRS